MPLAGPRAAVQRRRWRRRTPSLPARSLRPPRKPLAAGPCPRDRRQATSARLDSVSSGQANEPAASRKPRCKPQRSTSWPPDHRPAAQRATNSPLTTIQRSWFEARWVLDHDDASIKELYKAQSRLVSNCFPEDASALEASWRKRAASAIRTFVRTLRQHSCLRARGSAPCRGRKGEGSTCTRGHSLTPAAGSGTAARGVAHRSRRAGAEDEPGR